MSQRILDTLMAGEGSALVIGMGITGIESSLFLRRCGISIVCVESSSEAEYRAKSKFSARLEELEKLQIPLHFGVEGESVSALLAGVTLAVLSPGVSLESAIIGALQRRKIQLLSELELGIILAGVPSIIITGSNGKTTTATLVQHLLEVSGLPSLLCGNVGTPIVSDLTPEDVRRGKTERYKFLVVEASSYQLESCRQVRPKVGVFLNLSDNHLERHGAMQRYFDAKCRLFANQESSDFTVLNADDSWVPKIASSLKSTLVWFGKGSHSKSGKYRATISYLPQSGEDSIEIDLGGVKTTFSLSGSKLLGEHNRSDAAAALCAALLAGADPGLVQKALISFQPLEHRLELLKEDRGVLYVNDSKSTTVAASVAAVHAIADSYPSRPIILMIGGLAKAGSWDPLMRLVASKANSIREMICFGRDSRTLANHCEANGLRHRTAQNLRGAFEQARELARSGDVVLLSPGCASFDEFTDFEHRGESFKSMLGVNTAP